LTRSLTVESSTASSVSSVAWSMQPAGALTAIGDSPRDTPTEMPRDKVDVAKRVNDAYNRREVDGLFAELATPDFEYYPGIVRALDGAATADARASKGWPSTPAKTGRSFKPSLRSFAISAIGCLCSAG
jgi:hypothetical protein